MKNLNFFAVDEAVVMKVDPDMADYDNPTGEVIGFAGQVCAEDEEGNRWFHTVACGYDQAAVFKKAEVMADRLNVRAGLGKLPVAFSQWRPGRPAYGSPAYEAYGAEDDCAWEQALDNTESW